LGKFIETVEKDFINNYIHSFVNATDEYSKFQEGSPSFCTYYSVDTRATTTDPGLGQVVEFLGDESPIRYNKIENFPLYAMEELVPSLEFDEDTGLNTEMEGTALILPNTIVPNVNDVFVVSYAHIEKIYRVNNIETSSYSSKTFYKISFNKENSSTGILEEKQVIDNFNVVYRNIGTDYKVVIPKSEYLILDDLEHLYEELSKVYISYFYNSKVNSFIFNGDKINSIVEEIYWDKSIYDPKLALFINKNKLFIESRTYNKNIHIESLLEDRYFDYDYTLYNLIENPENSNYFYDVFYLIQITSSIFTLFREPYYELVHHKTFPQDLKHPLEYDMFSKSIKELLDSYTTLDDLNNTENISDLVKCVVIYLKEFNNLKLSQSFDYIKSVKVNKNLESYVLIPCILYILKQIKLTIFEKGR